MSTKAVTLAGQTQKYVTFQVGQELFGVHIQVVQQIISMPRITPVPRTPHFFLGMLNLRGETISTIDLRRRFNLPPTPPNPEKRVMIVDFRDSRLGLLVDRMGSVLNIGLDQLRPPPPLMDPATLEYLIASVQLDEHKTLLLLDQDRLMNPAEFQIEAINVRSDTTGQASTELAVTEPEHVLVGFKLMGEYYVMNINEVEEIIRLPKITQVPQVSNLIEGVFHLRNEVIPLLRLSLRLGLSDGSEELPDNAPVLVVNLEGVKIGLVVGEITEVLRIRESNIEPLPGNITGERAVHLRGIIQGQSGNQHLIHMLLILDKLFSLAELERLQRVHNTKDHRRVHDPKKETREETLFLLRFKVANEVYAVRLLQVNQITRLLPIVAVPKAPPLVRGVMNVRGEIITVLNTPKIFHSVTKLDRNLAKIVVVDVAKHKVGLIVEEVLGISYLSTKIFEEPEDWGNQDQHRLVEAIAREDNGQVTVLLDLDSLLLHAIHLPRHTKGEAPSSPAVEKAGTPLLIA